MAKGSLNRWFRRLGVIGTCWLALAAGRCSRPGTPSPADAPPATAGAADELAGAPEKWPEFLRWAADRLEARPAPEPLPNSCPLAEPRWPLIRLDDPARLAAARRSCDWTPAEAERAVLAAVGPFRSDQPGRDCVVGPSRGNGIRLVISGFDVQRERVGSIELTLEIPFGRHVEVQWSRAGTLLVPVESHARPFTVQITTDGLPEWRGPLRAIAIATDGPPGRKPVVIHSLRFLPRIEAYPEPIGVRRVRLGDQIRTAVYAHCPAEISYADIRIPPNGRLSVGIGSVTGSRAPGKDRPVTTFEITVRRAGRAETVLRDQFAGPAGWKDFLLPLDAWAGQTVSLTLRSTSPVPGTVACWSNPVIYQPVEDPPLLVIYLIDTVAAEHVNLYGYRRETMPRLTALASGGVWFARVFSNSSRTIESIPDLMLSLPTERVEVYHSSTAAPPELVTLAEALGAAGFATVSFCTNVNAGPRQGMDQGFDTFVDKISYFWDAQADRTVPLEEVRGWLERHRDRPAFVYIHTAEPHAPYLPPPGFAGRFDPDYEGRFNGRMDGPNSYRNIRDRERQRRDVEHIIALYDEEILYSDARLGAFLDALGELGLAGRARILVTSDHGEEFLEHGEWGHGFNLHNEQTKVPLVVAGPGFRRGARVDECVQLFDVMPTILDLFDLPAPHALQGISLLPLLVEPASGEAAAKHERELAELVEKLRNRRIYASNHNYRAWNDRIEYSVLADGRWKLIFGARPFWSQDSDPAARFALFDLLRDPLERQNVIGEQVGIARRLVADLVRWRVSQPPYEAGRRGPTQIDARHMRELEALGYIGQSEDEPNAGD